MNGKDKDNNNGIFIDSAFFVWKKTDKGYCWDDSLEQKEKFKDEVLIESPESTSYWNYYPLDDYPTLFLDFAGIEPTKENILEFVNQYGLLTESFYDKFTGSNKWGVRADGLRICQGEIRIMQEAVYLFELLKNSNLEELKKIFHWELNDESSKVTGIRYTHTIKDSAGIYKNGHWILPQTNPQIFPRFIVNDPVLPARVILQRIINDQLKKYPVRPRLLLDDSNKLQQYLFPTSLLAAMWYQLYQAIAIGKKFKRCAYCGKWVDVTDKPYNWKACKKCSDRVRSKRSWLKKKEADATQ